MFKKAEKKIKNKVTRKSKSSINKEVKQDDDEINFDEICQAIDKDTVEVEECNSILIRGKK